MIRHSRLSRRRGAGFTLVELLVAIIIAAVFFAAAVPLFANALRATRSDTQRVAAQSIAQQKMERIRELPFDQLQNLDPQYNTVTDLTTWLSVNGGPGPFDPTVLSYVGTASKTYTVSYTVTFTPTQTSALNAQYAQVVVKVSWADVSGATKSLSLATVISRQFSGPAISNVTLIPTNAVQQSSGATQQLAGAPTTITVYIPASEAGINNSSVKAVTVVVAAVNNGSFTAVTLTASAVSNANGVFRTSWNQSGAFLNTTYSFTAQAIAPNGSPGNAFSVNALLVGQNPDPVTSFNIAQGDGHLLLTWDNTNASDFDHYEIWRMPTSTSTTTMTQIVPNIQASGYIDTGLTNGTTYYYEVRAVDTQGNYSTWTPGSAAPASPATSATGPDTPGSFSATRPGSGSVANLSWTVPQPHTNAIAGYFIYRDGGLQPYARVAAASGSVGDAVSYTETIGYSVTHDYSVVAFDGVGLVSLPTDTSTVAATTVPTYTLTVTTAMAPPGVSIHVVQTDAQPSAVDEGTKTATNLAVATWGSLPYGSYQITATSGSQQITQNITLSANTTMPSGF